MSRIRSVNTQPELLVRSALHRKGFRFRLNSGMCLFGRPDIVLPKYRTVVFVHGCFWHRHPGCQKTYSPKSRVDFWNKKFADNVARDKIVRAKLKKDGWHTFIIWECCAKNANRLEEKIEFLRQILLRNEVQ